MSRTAVLSLPFAVAFAAAGVLLAPAPAAHAKPEFARKEKKECVYCHINPQGGGPRNDKGNEYQKNGFKFLPATKGYGEDGSFASEANGKAFALVREAIGIQHWSDALRRLGDLKSKEKKGSKGLTLLQNTETQVDARGKDLIATAREAVQAGKAPEAADALIRVEVEFKGRDAAKDVAKWRTELEKLPGGKDAEAVARVAEPQRLQWLNAQMKAIEGDKAAAIKLAEDLVAKFPDGPFTADAKARLAEWKGPSAPGTPAPGMGG